MCMRLRSGKAFYEMARPNTNNASASNTQSRLQTMQEQSTQASFNGDNVSNAMEVNAHVPVSRVMGVTALVFVSTEFSSNILMVCQILVSAEFSMGTNPPTENSMETRFSFMPQF